MRLYEDVWGVAVVIYFSATGNSKYIAEIVADRLCDAMENAADLIKTGELPELSSEKPFVFVSPTYAWRMPRAFSDFIRKCKMTGNKRAYFILTCGSEIGAAGNYARRLALKLGFEYMGTAAVVMPENYLVMFEPTAKEDDAEIIKSASAHAEQLCDAIIRGKPFAKPKMSLTAYLESGIVNSSFYTFYVGARSFFSTDACVSCGKCVDNCMMNNIVLKDGAPKWGKSCIHCMACICKCPTEAIEYGRHTKGRRRYVFCLQNEETEKTENS